MRSGWRFAHLFLLTSPGEEESGKAHLIPFLKLGKQLAWEILAGSCALPLPFCPGPVQEGRGAASTAPCLFPELGATELGVGVGGFASVLSPLHSCRLVWNGRHCSLEFNLEQVQVVFPCWSTPSRHCFSCLS